MSILLQEQVFRYGELKENSLSFIEDMMKLVQNQEQALVDIRREEERLKQNIDDIRLLHKIRVADCTEDEKTYTILTNNRKTLENQLNIKRKKYNDDEAQRRILQDQVRKEMDAIISHNNNPILQKQLSELKVSVTNRKTELKTIQDESKQLKIEADEYKRRVDEIKEFSRSIKTVLLDIYAEAVELKLTSATVKKIFIILSRYIHPDKCLEPIILDEYDQSILKQLPSAKQFLDFWIKNQPILNLVTCTQTFDELKKISNLLTTRK